MGPVKKAAVIHEKRTAATPEGEWPASRGFGYVTYALPQDATRSVTMLHGRAIRGRKISVTVSEKKPTQQELKAAKAAKAKAGDNSAGTSPCNARLAPMLRSWPCRDDCTIASLRSLRSLRLDSIPCHCTALRCIG